MTNTKTTEIKRSKVLGEAFIILIACLLTLSIGVVGLVNLLGAISNNVGFAGMIFISFCGFAFIIISVELVAFGLANLMGIDYKR